MLVVKLIFLAAFAYEVAKLLFPANDAQCRRNARALSKTPVIVLKDPGEAKDLYPGQAIAVGNKDNVLYKMPYTYSFMKWTLINAAYGLAILACLISGIVMKNIPIVVSTVGILLISKLFGKMDPENITPGLVRIDAFCTAAIAGNLFLMLVFQY